MLMKGIMATTKVDAHNMRICKEALEKAAQDISNGECALLVNIEHDLTTMPIGKVVRAHVDKYDDTDYALYMEQDIFEKSYSTTIDGQTYIMTKSLVDDRPFASRTDNTNDKLFIQTDSVNFESFDAAKDFLSELETERDVQTGFIARKSLIPDPELAFQLVEKSVTALFIYLASKTAIEKVGNHIIENALTELDSLYSFIKKAIITAAKRFHPQNRPVTYVFRGYQNFLIEFAVQTTNPNIAIESIKEEKLLGALEEIKKLQHLFSDFLKIQLVYNVDKEVWEFNYLTTQTGEVIGTEKAYNTTVKKLDIALPDKK